MFTILFFILTQMHVQTDVQIILDIPKGHTANKLLKDSDL